MAFTARRLNPLWRMLAILSICGAAQAQKREGEKATIRSKSQKFLKAESFAP
jgi:hypothetical protein